LHATAPAAHVFPQQEAVKSRVGDEEGELVEGLRHQRRGQILPGQSGVKGPQLPQHRRQSRSYGSRGPGVRPRSLSGRAQLPRRARQPRDGLALQQSGH